MSRSLEERAKEEEIQAATSPHVLYVLCPLSALSNVGCSPYKAEHRGHTVYDRSYKNLMKALMCMCVDILECVGVFDQ